MKKCTHLLKEITRGFSGMGGGSVTILQCTKCKRYYKVDIRRDGIQRVEINENV